jgi:hypothetical protein
MRQHRTLRLFQRSLALAGLAAAVAAMLAFPASASAAEATQITISAPSQPVASGDQVNVNILVAPGTAIAGLQMNLQFDPRLFEVESVTQGNLFTQDGALVFFNRGNIDNQEGVIAGAFGAITSPGQTVSREGTFATITLTAIADSAACPVVLSGIVVGDVEGEPVPAVVTNNGSLTAAAATATFSWWVLSLIIAAAVVLIAATAAGLLYRRHLLLKVPERY